MGFVEADDLWPLTPSTTSGSSAAKALYLMPSCQFPAKTQNFYDEKSTFNLLNLADCISLPGLLKS